MKKYLALNHHRSSAAAEKSGEGMALKIFTGAKLFLKANIKSIGFTGIEMLTLLIVGLTKQCT